jgi:hypothetical protein
MRAREAQLRLGLALIQRALDFLAGRRFLSQSERAAAGRGIERVALLVCYVDTTPRVEADTRGAVYIMRFYSSVRTPERAANDLRQCRR